MAGMPLGGESAQTGCLASALGDARENPHQQLRSRDPKRQWLSPTQSSDLHPHSETSEAQPFMTKAAFPEPPGKPSQTPSLPLMLLLWAFTAQGRALLESLFNHCVLELVSPTWNNGIVAWRSWITSNPAHLTSSSSSSPSDMVSGSSSLDPGATVVSETPPSVYDWHEAQASNGQLF